MSRSHAPVAPAGNRTEKNRTQEHRSADPSAPRMRTSDGPPHTASPRRGGPAQRVVRWVGQGGVTTILFGLPMVLCFSYFSWWPIVQSVRLSFEQTNLISPGTWVGLENFRHVLEDPLLWTAVKNTALFAALSLAIGFPVPLFLAVLIAELRRGSTLFRILAYLPVAIPPVVSVLLWKWFYDPDAGLFNQLLAHAGLGPYPWLQSTDTAMLSIVLEATWAGFGSTVIIYLAALGSVPTELYEAAEIDAAGIWRRVWHITLPSLRGVILIMLLLQIIGTLQAFTEPFVMTDGGPEDSTVTVLMLIYNYAFQNGDYGAATALSVLLALVLGVLSATYLRATKSWSN
ncbi:carbohydrate ABC transporter permease [Streptomyces sp. Ncost-T10-10d]|uniref:carbohydrate ABC transporter permease n=1 Tax=Streptomyces sp. Ncost-T10-10d TaxID=1839774 RepID=UPI00081D3A6B|nr:sugar ABC transporter permease [Streptomyces sp. Ncost-T10-10d]SCF71545.1 carbohydrate ABC transporter membrane protein 1, CUT1 family [Streptomyces sp. Ncost-T10-10d]